MSVKRWDAEHEHVNETGEFVLATDYDELLKLKKELYQAIIGASGAAAMIIGAIDMGDQHSAQSVVQAMDRRLEEARLRSEAFDASH